MLYFQILFNSSLLLHRSIGLDIEPLVNEGTSVGRCHFFVVLVFVAGPSGCVFIIAVKRQVDFAFVLSILGYFCCLEGVFGGLHLLCLNSSRLEFLVDVVCLGSCLCSLVALEINLGKERNAPPQGSQESPCNYYQNIPAGAGNEGAPL